MRTKGWYWTPERVVAAAQVFHEVYGRQPSYTDFNPRRDQVEAYERFHADNCWPSGATVSRHWGTWNAMIAAAGFEPVKSGNYPRELATHCEHGHEFTPENTRIRKSNGARICLTCNRAANNASYQRLYAGPGRDARVAGALPTKVPKSKGGRPKASK